MNRQAVLLVALIVALGISSSVDAGHQERNDGTCLLKAKDLMEGARNGTQPFGLSRGQAAERAAAYYLLAQADESCDW